MRRGVVGVDPGLHGGFACISGDGTATACPTPLLPRGKGEGKSQYDLDGMVRLVAAASPRLAVVEEVWARPGQGVTSMFRLGQGHGMWLGIFEALGVPVIRPTPQKWKKAILAPLGLATDDKGGAITYCRRVYPGAELVPPRRRVPHDGMADALCLADYGIHHHS